MTRFQGNLASVASNELIKWKRIPLEGEYDAFIGTLGKLEIKVHQQPRMGENASVRMEYSMRARRISTSGKWGNQTTHYTPCAYVNGSEAQRVYEKLERII